MLRKPYDQQRSSPFTASLIPPALSPAARPFPFGFRVRTILGFEGCALLRLVLSWGAQGRTYPIRWLRTYTFACEAIFSL